jgi:adenylate cyclase
MGPLARIIVVGFLTAAIGMLSYLLPLGFELEEDLGLDLMFTLRGPRPAPPEVVIVTIDKVSAARLGVADHPTRWPRDLHARLVDALSGAGATLIAFDIFFEDARDHARDRALANAIRRAGNVILYAYLEQRMLSMPGDPTRVSIERLQPPTPVLAAAPIALAPFMLPALPVATRQFTTFRRTAGDLPSLPAVSLQLYAMDVYPALLRLLDKFKLEYSSHLPRSAHAALNKFGLVDLMIALRTLFSTQPALAPAVLRELRRASSPVRDPETRHRIAALVQMYQGAEQPYLNFYGPPRSVTTLSYADVLRRSARASLDLQDKVVFIGFSEPSLPGQVDSFRTVYSDEHGIALSGVEIAATAFANLLERSTLHRPEPGQFIALVVGYSAVLAGLCLLLPLPVAMAAIAMFSVLYVGTCYHYFAQDGAWLPSMVPVLVQTPLAFLMTFMWHQRDTSRERKRLHHAFGYYLPDEVVDQLARDHARAHRAGETIFGICLVMDAEPFTRLVEGLEPAARGEFRQRYYRTVCKPVLERGGVISELIGEAMLALWSAPAPDGAVAAQACAAALDIARAVETLKANAEDRDAAVHIGVHAGLLTMDKAAPRDRYEERLMSDILNAAAEIQRLNKRLGTRVLVSDACLTGCAGLVTRELGAFRLAGSKQSVHLHEVLSHQDESALRDMNAEFGSALAAYRAQTWELAAERFARILDRFPDDGPSRFYLHACRPYLKQDRLRAGAAA